MTENFFIEVNKIWRSLTKIRNSSATIAMADRTIPNLLNGMMNFLDDRPCT
ncbi:MAG: hypothetical protein PUP90_07055 [Nostoc sp. S4]|nr:hypothetical protein [Nostoc sp. S4]